MSRCSTAVTLAVLAVVAVVVGAAGAARAHDPHGIPVGAHVGYAFRSSPLADDDRTHGVAASVVVDSPPLLWGFGVRGEGLALSWPATEDVDRPLSLFGGGAALTYRFDDTAVQALASFGVVGGVVVDEGADVGDVVGAWGGTAGLLLRFPLTEAASVDARLLLPILVGDERFNVQAAAMIGLSLAPDVVIGAAMAGRSPLSLIVPGFD